MSIKDDAFIKELESIKYGFYSEEERKHLGLNEDDICKIMRILHNDGFFSECRKNQKKGLRLMYHPKREEVIAVVFHAELNELALRCCYKTV